MGNLIYYGVAFLIVAIIAAVLGFGGATSVAIDGARLPFAAAVALLVLTLIGSLIRKS